MRSITPTLLLAIGITTATHAQNVVLDSVSIGTTNVAYYSLANDEQDNIINNNWDIAFEVTPGASSAIRINGQAGVELYEYPLGDTADWATVDITDIANWPKAYDSDQRWSAGAFSFFATESDFDLGWGTYSIVTHTVVGDRVFVIKKVDGTYGKVWIKSLASGTYTFRYASLDNATDETSTITKANYPGKNFVYFSLVTEEALDREPATTAWDLQFSKYIGDLGGGTWYGVSGILSNKGVYVAEAAGVDVETAVYTDFEADSFNISVIGSDWKAYDFGTNSYLITEDLSFFVSDKAGDIWQVIPTGFVGGQSGKFYFTKEKLTAVGVENADAEVSMVVYPNPATDGQTTLVYNQKTALATAQLFDMSGREVAIHSLSGQGFQQRTLALDGLHAGIYLLRLQDGATVSTSKIIVR